MHPKRLLDICINAFVQHTRDIQHSTTMSDKEKFLAVKRMWDELWRLPQNIPVFAGELLHAYLMCDDEEDLSLHFFIGLAANLRKNKIYESRFKKNKSPLRPESTYEKCYLQCSNYHLQELNVSELRWDFDISVLEEVIPKCPSLKELRLGPDANESLLVLAKKHCPLTVLHVKCFMNLDFCMELFFGVKNIHPSYIVQGVKKGRTRCLKVAWPNLTDLNLRRGLHFDFFVLARMVYKKLKYDHAYDPPSRQLLKKYLFWKHKVSELEGFHIGSWRYFESTEDEIVEMLNVASGIDYFRFMTRSNPDEKICKDFERFAEASLYPRVIIVNYPAIKKGIFSLLGKQAKKLLIEGSIGRGWNFENVKIKDLGEFLMDFPSLEQLAIFLNDKLKCDHEKLLADICLPQITSLIMCNLNKQYQNTCNTLIQMLPNLQEIMFFGPGDEMEPMSINFKMLSELRVLKVDDWNLVNFSDILDIPRDTRKSRRYELHGPRDELSIQDERKFVNSGWNYFPTSIWILEKECKRLYNEWP